MKVLLVGINAKYIHTNLAIRYLRNSIEELPIEVSIYEPSINNHFDDVLMNIYIQKPDILGFSCYIWNIEMVNKLCSSLSKVLPDTKIVLGGPEVSFETVDYLKQHPYIHCIIKGEGEIPFKKVIQAINTGVSIENIPAVMTKNTDNNMGEVPDLTDRIFPYNGEDLTALSQQILYYEASRGCPFSCSYCLSSTTHGVRYVDVEKVKKELELISQATSMIKFVDRTFNCDIDKTIDILTFIKNLDTETTFHLEISAHLITEELLNLLEQMPLNRIQLEIGVQTTNEESVKAIQRSTNFKKIKEIVSRVNHFNNIHQHLDLIAGLPYENFESFKKSFNDVMALKPHKLQLGFLKLLKGSKIREESGLHQYKFNEFAPYEILESKYIKFHEMIKLKGIEHLLETFYNSHKFEKTMEYLHGKLGNYFEVYEKIYEFYQEKNLVGANISHNDLYQLLEEFSELVDVPKNVFMEILKYDYLLHKRTNTLPEFFGEKTKLKERVFEFLKDPSNIEKYIPHFSDIRPTEIYKQIIVEKFAVNPISLKEEVVYLLFDYKSKEGLFEKPRVLEINI
ncbi:B12-binding domain-containing radical SAM protein [Alkalicella caledoniensis]|uniref:B12-binding domain-containing radical SAM protein n=1 Tax=Alkalicella caledoniensis TaxID=2731377 RepID=A0A7G9W513_ALKCA|nr:B12-binding domain-containing radical SAM protein [Alkalicella caledoniensis]QNO13775.1 B12-binding domain-containing radical SAM protein [Alkalicella caledoniensis]